MYMVLFQLPFRVKRLCTDFSCNLLAVGGKIKHPGCHTSSALARHGTSKMRWQPVRTGTVFSPFEGLACRNSTTFQPAPKAKGLFHS